MMTLGQYVAWLFVMRNWAIITYIGMLNMANGLQGVRL